MRRNGFAGLGAGLVLAMLLAACGSTSGGATAAPSVTPTPEPSAPLGLFTGHDVCRGVGLDSIVCRRTATDPRLAGTLTSDAAVGTGNDPDLFIAWRTFTMSNGGGAWTCERLLLGIPGSAGGSDEICTGEDGYAGLTAYIHAISGNDAADFGLFGWIEEEP